MKPKISPCATSSESASTRDDVAEAFRDGVDAHRDVDIADGVLFALISSPRQSAARRPQAFRSSRRRRDSATRIFTAYTRFERSSRV